MRNRLPRYAGTACRTAIVVASLAFLASCTTAGAPVIQTDAPSYTSTTAVTEDGSTALAAAAAEAGGTMPTNTGAAETGNLPQQVAALPTQSPAAIATTDAPAVNALVAPPAGAQAATTLPAPAQPGTAADAVANRPAATPNADNTSTTAATPAVDPAMAGDGSVVMAAAAMPPAQKKQGFLASFFGAGAPNGGKAATRDSSGSPKAQLAKASVKQAEIKTARATLPVDTADEGNGGEPAFAAGGGSDLPGVRKTALFEIKRRSGMDDDADVDIYEEEDGGPVVLASAAGMARLAPNGLLRQTESVDVACLKPSLVRALKQIERHYGKKMVVTSGYRSPSHNRRARGAKNSLHMYCAAADIQVPGVGKWELASYARSIQGRGGVGTYCHTNSIHVDVGPERDWNWRCRGRKRK